MQTVDREAELEEGGGGDRQEGYRYGDGQIIRWQDIVANLILGTEPNDLFAYAPRLELHHPIMSMLGGHRGRVEREIK